MRLLLDTHLFQWLAKSPALLSAVEHNLFARKDVRLLVSAITILELRTKWNSFHPSGDRKGSFAPAEAVAFAHDAKIELVTLTPENCAVPLDAAVPHRDPFDEMLLVHAQILGAQLLTRDRALAGHPLVYRFA